MHASLLLAAVLFYLGSAHMIVDDRQATKKAFVSNSVSQNLEIDTPPVVIVELVKSTKKTEKPKKQKKSKFVVRKRPPPPANCTPLGESCKSPGNVCCDFCAFCQCRLFKTVCLCRMGNPSC